MMRRLSKRQREILEGMAGGKVIHVYATLIRIHVLTIGTPDPLLQGISPRTHDALFVAGYIEHLGSRSAFPEVWTITQKGRDAVAG